MRRQFTNETDGFDELRDEPCGHFTYDNSVFISTLTEEVNLPYHIKEF